MGKKLTNKQQWQIFWGFFAAGNGKATVNFPKTKDIQG